MRPVRVVAPQGPLVPVQELRDHVRAETDEQDDVITAYERAAVDYLDGYSGRLGRCILRQKWAIPLIGNPDTVVLPFPGCHDAAIERKDSVGGWVAVPDAPVEVMDDHALLPDLPSDGAGLSLTFWAGEDDPSDVPENLKQAVRLMVAHWFENRSAVATGQAPHEVPMAVEAMISPLVYVFA